MVCMNADQTLIQSAYEDAIRKLYTALFDSYATSGGDQSQQQQADQSFSAGVGFAKKARERATALLA
jgi:hypothetical protein